MHTLIEPPNLAVFNLRAFFTTKLSVDEKRNVKDVLSEKFNIPMDSIYMPIQKHTDAVQVLDSNSEPVIADAVVTARRNCLLGIAVADCVPVLLYDNQQRVAGAVHAGWRGTAANILPKTIRTMRERYGCIPANIMVSIGPSIRQCSYEVDEEVKTEVQNATGKGDYILREKDRYFIDISSANKMQALNEGISAGNIWQSEECTYCNPERFFSYRFSRGTSPGRQGGFIGMW